MFVFVSVCFVSTVLRKGSVAAKGAIPDAFAWQHDCRSRWNCAWLNLLCHGQMWCVVQTPQHKAATKEKAAKRSHVEPQTRTKSSPEFEQVPQKGSEECDLAKLQGERPNVGLHARDRSENTIFRGPVYVSHFVIVSVVAVNEPKKRFFPQFPWRFCPTMSNFATRRVRSRPKFAAPQGERFFSAPTHAGPQGERSKKVRGGAFWTAPRGPKVAFFARYRGPKTRSAPQENPPSETVRQKWSETGLQNINCAPFFLDANIFRTFSDTRFFGKKTKRPKTGPRRETRRNEAFSRFSLRDRTAKTRKNAQNEELRGSPKRIEKSNFLRFFWNDRPARKAKRHSFRHFSRPLETPIFVAFWPPRFASGSLAALRGLPRSHVFDRFRAPLAFQQDICPWEFVSYPPVALWTVNYLSTWLLVTCRPLFALQ